MAAKSLIFSWPRWPLGFRMAAEFTVKMAARNQDGHQHSQKLAEVKMAAGLPG